MVPITTQELAGICRIQFGMPTQPLVRILVIDDEPIIRLDAREILEDAGYVVTEAASADEALPLLADGEATEAILTDINMPGTLDGLELARIVDGLMPEIAIVLMSGKELPRRENLPLKATFVAKPFSASALLQRVAEFRRAFEE
jgi:CheY-like chemotaxis protein